MQNPRDGPLRGIEGKDRETKQTKTEDGYWKERKIKRPTCKVPPVAPFFPETALATISSCVFFFFRFFVLNEGGV